ncbi:MAG: THUMP domain-containing protein [Phycisphaerales bacterium]
MGGALRLIVVTAFGLESVVKHELAALGYLAAVTEPGRLEFHADPSAVARTNIWLRAASRVLVHVAEFPAEDFDALYEGVRGVAWSEIIDRPMAIGVRARTARSAINSPRSTQSIVKRAVVDAIAGRTGRLDEAGPPISIDAAVVRDRVTLAIDTTGPGLHRRGYRPNSGPGQLKETLAAGIVQLTRWQPDRPLIDPFCGQGTIVIEAALLGAGLAPGASRSFAAEQFGWIDAEHWATTRVDAAKVELPGHFAPILGRDISSRAVAEARRAADRAGVKGLVGFRTGDYHDITRAAERGWIVTNPPYGLRVLDKPEARTIHAELPGVLAQLPGWSHAILTAFPDFEAFIRQDATRRRKLYNGSIQCGLYFFLPRRDAELKSTERVSLRPAFGDTSDRDDVVASFEAALRRRVRHLRRWPVRLGTDAFRLYDGQTPGAGIAVDRLGPWLRITDLRRPSDRPVGERRVWLERLVAAVERITECPRERIAVVSPSHKTSTEEVQVREHHEAMLVRPGEPGWGPPLDGRLIRERIAEASRGKRVLHLGAADPGAIVASVRSGAAEVAVQTDHPHGEEAMAYAIRIAAHARPRLRPWADATDATGTHAEKAWDLVIWHLQADPAPGHGQRRAGRASVGLDRPLRIARELLAAGGQAVLVARGLRVSAARETDGNASLREITNRTVPEDYSHSKPHRSWLVRSHG